MQTILMQNKLMLLLKFLKTFRALQLEGNHENSIGLSMILPHIVALKLVLNRNNTNGTFEIVLSEQAQGNDTYFDF